VVDLVTEIIESKLDVKKRRTERLRYLVAVIGFLLVVPEWMLAFYEIAFYQLLMFSLYLLFNILVDVSSWTERYWAKRFRRKVSYPEGKLIYGIILIPSWWFFNWLLEAIAPWIPYVTIWWISFGIVMALILSVSAYRYISKERESVMAQTVRSRTLEKKRIATRRAIWVSLLLIAPYISVIVILSALGVLSHQVQSLAIFAFLPLAFFTMMLSGGIAKRSPSKETLEGGIFWAMLTAIPFVVAVFTNLSFSYQIPYICVLAITYLSFFYWLRSVRAKNMQKRLAKKKEQIINPT